MNMLQSAFVYFILIISAIYDLRKREIPKWLGFLSITLAFLFAFNELNIMFLLKCLILILLLLLGAIGGGDFKIFLLIATFIPYIHFLIILFLSLLVSYLSMHLNVREPPTLVFMSLIVFLRELLLCLSLL